MKMKQMGGKNNSLMKNCLIMVLILTNIILVSYIGSRPKMLVTTELPPNALLDQKHLAGLDGMHLNMSALSILVDSLLEQHETMVRDAMVRVYISKAALFSLESSGATD